MCVGLDENGRVWAGGGEYLFLDLGDESLDNLQIINGSSARR